MSLTKKVDMHDNQIGTVKQDLDTQKLNIHKQVSVLKDLEVKLDTTKSTMLDKIQTLSTDVTRKIDTNLTTVSEQILQIRSV